MTTSSIPPFPYRDDPDHVLDPLPKPFFGSTIKPEPGLALLKGGEVVLDTPIVDRLHPFGGDETVAIGESRFAYACVNGTEYQLDAYKREADPPRVYYYKSGRWYAVKYDPQVVLDHFMGLMEHDADLDAQIEAELSKIPAPAIPEDPKLRIPYREFYHQRFPVVDHSVTSDFTLLRDGRLQIADKIFDENTLCDCKEQGATLTYFTTRDPLQVDIRYHDGGYITYIYEFNQWFSIVCQDKPTVFFTEEQHRAISGYHPLRIPYETFPNAKLYEYYDYEKTKDYYLGDGRPYAPKAVESISPDDYEMGPLGLVLRKDGYVLLAKDADWTRSGFEKREGTARLATYTSEEVQVDFHFSYSAPQSNTSVTYVYRNGAWFHLSYDGHPEWYWRSCSSYRIKWDDFRGWKGKKLGRRYSDPVAELEADGTIIAKEDGQQLIISRQRPRLYHNTSTCQLHATFNLERNTDRPYIQVDIIGWDLWEVPLRTYLFLKKRWIKISYPWDRGKAPKPKGGRDTIVQWDPPKNLTHEAQFIRDNFGHKLFGTSPEQAPDTSGRGELLQPSVSEAQEFMSDAIDRAFQETTRPQNFDPIMWGGLPIRDEISLQHFFIHGVTGSGKSIVFKDLLFQALNRYNQDPRVRILLTDPKGDVPKLLEDVGFGNKYRQINPFARDSFAWDFARDLADPVAIKNFATFLFPIHDASPRFWPEAARRVFFEVVSAFIHQGSDWRLRDVILALRDPDHFAKLISRTESGKAFLKSNTKTKATEQNVLQQAQMTMQYFEELAQASEAAYADRRTFSIVDWALRNDTQFPILVLGHAAAGDQLLEKYYQGILERAAMELTGETAPELKNPITWIMFDEAMMLATYHRLEDFADRGRAKGVLLALATQSGPRFIDRSNKSRAGTGEFIEGIVNKQLLQATAKSAEWSSKLFGKTHRKVLVESNSETKSQATTKARSDTQSVNSGQGGLSGGQARAESSGSQLGKGVGSGKSTSHHIVQTVDASVFESLPEAKAHNEVQTFIRSDSSIGGGAWHDVFPIKSPDGTWPQRQWPPLPVAASRRQEIDRTTLFLKGWDVEELEDRLFLPATFIESDDEEGGASQIYEPDDI